MIDEQKGKNNQNIFQEYSKSLTAFISMKKGENKNNLYKLLEEASNSLKQTKTPENIARSAIIEFILKYTKSLTKNNIINKLIGKFPKCFPKEDVVEMSLSKIDDELNESSPLKAMVSFGKDISKNKKYLELCFKLILLEQNIESLISNPAFTFVLHDVTQPFWAQVDEIYNLACPASPIHYQKNPVETIKTSLL